MLLENDHVRWRTIVLAQIVVLGFEVWKIGYEVRLEVICFVGRFALLVSSLLLRKRDSMRIMCGSYRSREELDQPHCVPVKNLPSPDWKMHEA